MIVMLNFLLCSNFSAVLLATSPTLQLVADLVTQLLLHTVTDSKPRSCRVIFLLYRPTATHILIFHRCEFDEMEQWLQLRSRDKDGWKRKGQSDGHARGDTATPQIRERRPEATNTRAESNPMGENLVSISEWTGLAGFASITL